MNKDKVMKLAKRLILWSLLFPNSSEGWNNAHTFSSLEFDLVLGFNIPLWIAVSLVSWV